MTDNLQRPGAAAVAELLQQVRENASISQAELADRAGMARSTVSAYESGQRVPSLAALNRLLGALGKQLRLVAEPRGSDLDAAIDAALTLSAEERLQRNAGSLVRILENMRDVPLVIEGALAALLQGAPVPVEALEVAVAETDLEALAAALKRMYAQRWSKRWNTWGYEIVDPREEGEPRWTTIYGEIRVRVVPRRPSAVELRAAELSLAVRPLVELEASDAEVRRILARVQQRLRSAA